MRIGIVGLGYVGLPLAVAFAEAGHDVVGFDVDAGRVELLGSGESDIEDVGSARLAGPGEQVHGDDRGGSPGRVRRDPDLRADAARRRAGAGPDLRPRLGGDDRRDHARGPARRPRVDDLSGNDPGGAPAGPRARRPEGGGGIPPRLLARADRPGPQRAADRRDAEGRRRHHRRLHRPRRRRLRGGLQRGRARLLARRRPSSRSCSRTSSARSTSPSSTSWRSSPIASRSTSGR